MPEGGLIMKRLSTSRVMVLFAFLAMTVVVTGVSVYAQAAKEKALPNIFKEAGSGFTMGYPGDWSYQSRSPHTVIFSGKKGPEAGVTVGMQNLSSTKVQEGRYKDVQAVIAELENQLRVGKDVKVFSEKPFKYAKGGVTLQGKEFTAEYTYKNQRFRQWVIVIPRPDGTVFHNWFFLAPANSYHTYLGTAQAMLNSLTLF
jgi:hypothetical protein